MNTKEIIELRKIFEEVAKPEVKGVVIGWIVKVNDSYGWSWRQVGLDNFQLIGLSELINSEAKKLFKKINDRL